VARFQSFLNQYLKTDLDTDGIFGPQTQSAVTTFQEKHANEILSPWNFTSGTGEVSTTTNAVANTIVGCEPSDVTINDTEVSKTLFESLRGIFKLN